MNLGYMYMEGRGVARDDVQAVEWFRKSAEQGCADGQYHLGKMYEAGCGGLAQDDAEALSWYSKAAEQGNAEAKEAPRRIEVEDGA